MRIHALIRKPFSQHFYCEGCSFVGSLADAIAHAVRHQFVVTR